DLVADGAGRVWVQVPGPRRAGAFPLRLDLGALPLVRVVDPGREGPPERDDRGGDAGGGVGPPDTVHARQERGDDQQHPGRDGGGRGRERGAVDGGDGGGGEDHRHHQAGQYVQHVRLPP